ncbi:MAG TPA: hypothetical protein VMF50_16910 [Candidatus Binataceae bacterium]|nr:hypothetical protein [Candidatus Binataceae bacterium]
MTSNEWWALGVVALLGAYHGADPSMGWLFAVGLGLQERRVTKVWWSLLPIAAGHLLSVGLVVALVAVIARISWLIRPLGAAILIGFGIFRWLRPRAHPRWVAMRVNALDLAMWSFLMASAHGAGLMLLPVLIGIPQASVALPSHHAHFIPTLALHGPISITQSAAVILIHTGAMLTVMGTIATVVYEWAGLGILRSAWINLEGLWAGALIAAGVLSLVI